MARRPPAPIRPTPPRGYAAHTPVIPGISARGQAAIRQLEFQHFWPGAAAQALTDLIDFLRGSELDPWQYCLPCCDPRDHADTIDHVLAVLPPRDAESLRRRLDTLDHTDSLRRRLATLNGSA